MKMIVYYLGNPNNKNDSQIFGYIKKLEKQFGKISFIHLDPAEQIDIPDNNKLIILDTVIGIKKVTLFPDLESFQLSPRISPHDYDLPLELGLLIKLKKIKGVKIIGLPVTGNKGVILHELATLIKSVSKEIASSPD